MDQVYPGDDGLVRVVDFRTSDGAIYNRGVSRLSLLEPNSSVIQLPDSGEDGAAKERIDLAASDDVTPPEGPSI